MTDTNDYDEFVCACGTASCRRPDHGRRLEAPGAPGALRGLLLVVHHPQDRGDRGHRALTAQLDRAGRRSAHPRRACRRCPCRPPGRRRTRLRCAARRCCPCRGTRCRAARPAPYARVRRAVAVVGDHREVADAFAREPRRRRVVDRRLVRRASTRSSISTPAGSVVGLQPLREVAGSRPGSAGTSARRRRSPWRCRRRPGS